MAENASESITATHKTTVIMEKELNKSEKKTDAAAKGPGYISPFLYVKHFPLQLDQHLAGSPVCWGARRASWAAAPSQGESRNPSCH